MASWGRMRVAAIGGALALAALGAMAGCTVHTQGGAGEDKKVEIKTPIGGVSINSDNTPEETGLAVYPGARIKQDSERKHKSANVNLSSSRFGLKVAVIEMMTDDAPEKVTDFYRKELAKYGKVLECSGRKGVTIGWNSSADGEDRRLGCGDKQGGQTLEMKVGTRDNQHLVAIETKDGRTEFTLVYVRMRGKDDAL